MIYGEKCRRNRSTLDSTWSPSPINISNLFVSPFGRTRRRATAGDAFTKFKAWFKPQSGHMLKLLGTDEGTEFAEEMLLKSFEIGDETTAAYISDKWK